MTRAAEPIPFGRYLLKERLAQGGMGEVFRAVAVGESGFEKPVVVKRILPQHASRGDFAELFIAEAKLMTRLAHPNIVGVLDFGRGERGDYFLVLELVDGLDLGRLMRAHEQRGERFPVPLALFVIAQVLRGLHHAHVRPESEGGGLVHRDISPGNVLLSREGEVKVADFGVALARGEEPPTRVADPAGSGAGRARRGLVGKLAYMAPEQYDGAEVDPGADIFSAGVLLFQLLAGALPFAGTTGEEQQAAAHKGEAGDLRALRPEVTEEIAAIVRRALSPRRGDRFPDARAMAQVIEGLRDRGQRVADRDDLADAVRAAMVSLPAQGKRVISLSASAPVDDTEERELTRTGGAGGVGAFTLRMSDRTEATVRDGPTAAQRLDLRADPVADHDVSQRAPPATPGDPAGEGDTVVVPLETPLGPGARAAIAALVLAAVALFWFLYRPQKDPATGPSAGATAPASAPPSAPPPSSIEVPALVVAPPVSAAPSGPRVAPPPRAPASLTPVTTLTAAPAPAPEPADCVGSVKIASTGSWTVSGGPQAVQSPGVYTWKCGTFSLHAVSRADPTQRKDASVTVRAGATSVVDLR